MYQMLHELRESLRALSELPMELRATNRAILCELELLRKEQKRMSATVDSIQQETAGLQSHWAGVKTALADFQAAMTKKLTALQDQITVLHGSGVDPALLTPLATLQTDMQTTTDGLHALTNPPPATPAPAATPEPTPVPTPPPATP